MPVKTVRYYADIGLVVPLGRTDSGYRSYGEEEVCKLGFVRRARSFGFSIAKCRELLSLYEDQSRHCRDVKRIAKERIFEIETKLDELGALHQELEHLIDSCSGDDGPDCPILDGLAGNTIRS